MGLHSRAAATASSAATTVLSSPDAAAAGEAHASDAAASAHIHHVHGARPNAPQRLRGYDDGVALPTSPALPMSSHSAAVALAQPGPTPGIGATGNDDTPPRQIPLALLYSHPDLPGSDSIASQPSMIRTSLATSAT
ncbi:hypothetical protein HK405_011209, partial [Cladochytrium tenue]